MGLVGSQGSRGLLRKLVAGMSCCKETNTLRNLARVDGGGKELYPPPTRDPTWGQSLGNEAAMRLSGLGSDPGSAVVICVPLCTREPGPRSVIPSAGCGRELCTGLPVISSPPTGWHIRSSSAVPSFWEKAKPLLQKEPWPGKLTAQASSDAHSVADRIMVL